MKKTLHLLLFAACLLWTASALRAQNLQKGDYGYLYCHMSGRGEWTAYALSRDGLKYHDLLGGDSIFSPTEKAAIEGGTRDAYICRKHDGSGYLMVTTDMCVRKSKVWDNYGINLLTSDDLIHWESKTFDFRKGATIFSDPESPDVYRDYSAVNRVWAPQVIWHADYCWPDGRKGGYFVYYSLWNRAEEKYDRMYYSYADETFTTLTKPRLLFDWGYATIDADIHYLESDGLFHLMVKKEGGKPGLFTATAPALTGPWSEPLEDDYVDFEGNKKCEGVSAFQLVGDSTWCVGYIEYSSNPKRYRICRADKYLRNFHSPRDIEGVEAPQHGSFMRLTREEYERLEKHYSASSSNGHYKTVKVDAPFPMEPIQEFIFPDREFSIADYGAVEGGEVNNTAAIADAIRACNKAGGGKVVVPAGEWLTGPVHFKSNVNLHLAEGAVLRFTDKPEDYLPAVMTSWEGLECYNYSPLLYAYGCENVAITGSGTISPRMETWKEWFKRPQPHMDALKQLYTMASTDVPVEQRQMAVGENHLRPHLIHFNRCKNVLLDGFKIRESPFWTIHLYLCDGGIARRLDVRAHGHNNDGIDLEMSRNFLVEECVFDQGDDAVVIKAGRNRDAWRLNTPSENIVIRNCTISKGHTLLGIGSEMSGGIRNVYMHDCVAPNTVHRLFFVKTNHRRGGFIENIHMENVKVGGALSVLEADADVLYQWRTLVPTYEKRITRISGLYINKVECGAVKRMYELKGDKRLPIKDVEMKNVHVGCLADTINRVTNAENVKVENVTYDKVDAAVLPELDRYISNK